MSSQTDRRAFVLAMLPRAAVGAEIGVHKGDFSEQILRHARPAELHLIDPWRYEASDEYRSAWYGGGAPGGQAEMDERYWQVLERFRQPIRAGRVVVHRGSSAEVGRGLPDGYFDWVYIDGNHLYEFVKSDLELYYEKVKPGGLITGDDYHSGGWWKGGVKRAVDEFTASRSAEIVVIRNNQFVLKRLS